MNELFKFGTSICILMIIATLVANLTENFKNGRQVRSAVAVLIIIVSLNFILNIDLSSDELFTPEKYAVDSSAVWEKTLESVSEQLENEMINMCDQNGLDIDKIEVSLKTDYKNFEVKSVSISGNDSQSAKNLIAGYFKIGLAYININGD